jgi:hypothetical protein
VTVTGTKTSYSKNEDIMLGVNIFDISDPYIKIVKVPVEAPSIVMRDVYYAVVDAVKKETVIPFDFEKNATRVSSNASGMFFTPDTSAFTPGNLYEALIMIIIDGKKTVFASCCPAFKIEA